MGAPSTSEVNKIKQLFLNKVLPTYNLKDSLVRLHVDIADGMTTGNIIFEFATHESAVKAQEDLNNLPLTKTHTFATYTFDEFDEILCTQEQYTKPNYKTMDQLFTWINDEKLRDQFIFRSGDKIIPFWFNNVEKTAERIKLSSEQDGTDSQKKVTGFTVPATKTIKWTQNGEYLIVMERGGVAIYGGETWDLITRFEHAGAKDAKLSPLGNYLLTYNGTAIEAGDSKNIIVWNFFTGKKLRDF